MPNRHRRPEPVLTYACHGCATTGQAATRLIHPVSRRTLLRGMAGLALAARYAPAAAQSLGPAFSYPMGISGQALGDGLIVRHGYACENTIVQTGWLHTAEDWYRTNGAETGGSRVYTVGAGEVVFAGYDYPGLVVIVEHAPDLFSMYGHLDYAVAVELGQVVDRGQLIGTVLTQIGRRVPSHLHFEMRNFFINPVVNGENPSHGVHCGVNCPPGPGYWPTSAPEHPTAIGWRNPSHVINGRAFAGGVPPRAEVVVAELAPAAVDLWSAPATEPGAEVSGSLAVRPGERFRLLNVSAGPEASAETSANGYQVWYEIQFKVGERTWVQAAVPSLTDTGADGRPSAVVLAFLPDVRSA
ncbi:MAG: M23 family metallopeptidase [Chloroflexia bacterium]|nr:M23 family metallopeptidase [Chloroflexia bacterium]